MEAIEWLKSLPAMLALDDLGVTVNSSGVIGSAAPFTSHDDYLVVGHVLMPQMQWPAKQAMLVRPA